MRRRVKNRRGFTIIEIIIAMTVFIVGIVSLFPLFSRSMNLLGDIRAKNVAANLARTLTAQIESRGFDAMPSNESNAFAAPHDEYSYAITWSPLRYDVAAPATPVLMRADIVISWDEGTQSERFVVYQGKMNP